ncbi:hypothetical protein DL768_000343 [Monosporascus sp. mg162]|nr:hypothetical protein DL768_000343 [Monosporascus sp. mg162]
MQSQTLLLMREKVDQLELRPISDTQFTAELSTVKEGTALFRRNFQMLGVVFVSAFAFEMAYDSTMNKIWDNLNKGRQWKDIRHKYVQEE